MAQGAQGDGHQPEYTTGIAGLRRIVQRGGADDAVHVWAEPGVDGDEHVQCAGEVDAADDSERRRGTRKPVARRLIMDRSIRRAVATLVFPVAPAIPATTHFLPTQRIAVPLWLA